MQLHNSDYYEDYHNEEEKQDYKEDENINIYDEDSIPLNKYKEAIFKKTAIKQTKGKGKYIKKIDLRDCLNTYYCKCGKCILDQIYSEKFDIKHSKSLFDYSNILKEYKKESKIFNDKNFIKFFIDKNKFSLNLIYKASENKFLIKNLIKNMKNNESKKTIAQLIIIKFSNDLYFAFLDSYSLFLLYGFICFFTSKEIKYGQRFSKFFNCYDNGLNTIANVSENYTSRNIRNNTEKEYVNPYFSFKDSFSKGIFNRTIKLKNLILKKNRYFSVIDLECFNINIINN